MPYQVFVSHGWDDRWVARQMARLVAEAGAEPFIDLFDIQKGDRIDQRVLEGLRRCDELVCLLTPWAVDRNWVWAEMSGVWALGKRFVAVLYGVSRTDIDARQVGWLASIRTTPARSTSSMSTSTSCASDCSSTKEIPDDGENIPLLR